MVMAAGMAVARHRDIDDIRIDLAQLRIAEAPFLQHPGAEILDHDIGDGDQPLHDLQAPGAADIEAEALFVDVGVVEVPRGVQIDLEVLRRRGTRQPAALILRPLDLYDLGPQSPEPARRPWPGPHPAEIDHANVFEGARSRHGRHSPTKARPRKGPSEAPKCRRLPWVEASRSVAVRRDAAGSHSALSRRLGHVLLRRNIIPKKSAFPAKAGTHS